MSQPALSIDEFLKSLNREERLRLKSALNIFSQWLLNRRTSAEHSKYLAQPLGIKVKHTVNMRYGAGEKR